MAGPSLDPGECFRTVTGWLVRHGWTDDEIIAVIGGNVLRVLEKIW